MPPLTQWEAESLRAAFLKVQRRPMKLPLPRRVRLRLWFTGRIDATAVRLVERDRFAAAERLWRLCRMW